jgi:hypothetical protein
MLFQDRLSCLLCLQYINVAKYFSLFITPAWFSGKNGRIRTGPET